MSFGLESGFKQQHPERKSTQTPGNMAETTPRTHRDTLPVTAELCAETDQRDIRNKINIVIRVRISISFFF